MTPEVKERLAALEDGTALCFEGVDVVRCEINEEQIFFTLDREPDQIQRNHRIGRFFERKELRWIGTAVEPGATFLDIGSNIGNHALYFAKFLKAAKVIPIEPNPVAYRLLMSNVVLNRLSDVIDMRYLGVGLSAERSGGFAVQKKVRNLGATKMLPEKGEIEVHSGDELFEGIVPDFIKIDVEGMEMGVLSGLDRTISAHRPNMLIEVDAENDDDFKHWLKDRRYVIRKKWQHYVSNRNYLLIRDE